MNADPGRAKSIFLSALDIAAHEERQAYLAAQCGADAALRREVEGLLRHQAQAGRFLEAPTPGAQATVDAACSERPGDVIGPYKLLEQIGEGGFGIVFMAEQQAPVRRKVALKVLKPGMDTRQVVARFEAERQALALMEHPNIARVFDGGQTASGRPYFVMELVRGTPVTEYCDMSRLPIRQRLELFITICQAVQHAHQKGVIHRDLKPSNVLVSSHDVAPVVKVIDFGVAKAMSGSLSDKTVFTGFAQMIGTPLYMSPEQAGQSNLDVDTRSDIYSLGVVLYELLTGTTPFDKETLSKLGHDEMRRVIREEEPPRPSTRLSTLGQEASTVAANRQSEPGKLSRQIRGELDWVVMKALEKDRNRRYESASAFAADVGRYLSSEAVLACPPSLGYRLRKFARRNRARLAVATALALLLLAAGAFGWHADRQAAQRRADAENQHRDKQARLERNAEAVANLLDQCEAALRADRANEAALAVGAAGRRAADGGAEALTSRLSICRANLKLLRALDDIDIFRWSWGARAFPGHKAVGERCRAALADYGVTADESRTKEAADRVNNSLVRERLLAALDLWLASARPKGVAALLRAADPDTYRDAVREALIAGKHGEVAALGGQPEAVGQPPRFAAILGWLRDIPEDRARTVMESALQGRPGDLTLLMQLGISYDVDRPEGAGERLRWFQAALAAHPGNLAALNNLGIALRGKGDPDRAIAYLKEATLRDPNFANAHFNLSRAQRDKGQLDEAIASLRKVIELDREDAADAHYDLGIVWLDKKDPAKAMAAYKEGVRLDPDFAIGHYHFGRALDRNGDPDGAIAAFRRAVEINHDYLDAHINLGAILCDVKHDYEGAIAAFNEAIRIEPNGATGYFNLGNALDGNRNIDRAIEAYRKAIKINPDYADAHVNLAGMLSVEKGDKEGAFFHLREALRVNPKRADAHSNLGYVQRAKADLVGAEASFREAIRLKPDDYVALHGLLLVLGELGVLDQALPLLQKAAADMETGHFRHKRAAGVVNDLIGCHERLKQFDHAEPWRRKWLAVVKEQAGGDSSPYAAELAALGSNLLRQRKWTHAEAVLRECLALAEQEAPDTWYRFDVQSMLGGALLGQKRYAEAERLLLEGYEGMKRHEKATPPQRRARSREAVLWLVELYDATEKKTAAAKWRPISEQHEGTKVGPVHDVGDFLKLDGNLDGKTATLRYEVRLRAGKTYVIDMVSPTPKALDPYLLLKDADLELLAEDDDSGGGLNARLIYRATRDGVYRILATSFDGGRGEFTLTVRERK